MEEIKELLFFCRVCGARIDEEEFDPLDEEGAWICVICGATFSLREEERKWLTEVSK